MNDLYEVLEVCLQDIEQGADIDTVLFRYPDLAEELRPILEASRNASSLAVPGPSHEVIQRNRVKVLQRAAQLRAAKSKSSKQIWFASFRRVAVTLVVITVLFVSGTSLVRAASATVPGDNLYPVKRTWEDVLLLLTFNLQEREALEVQHENERHHELQELFAEGRSEDVEFSGRVTSQNGNEWVVSPGITVLVSAQTELRDGPVAVGDAIRVEGETQSTMTVSAEEIQLLPPDAKLPDVGDGDDEHEGEEKNHEGSRQQIEIDSSQRSEGALPTIEATKRPASNSETGQESPDGESNGAGPSEPAEHTDNHNDEDSHDDGEDPGEDSKDSEDVSSDSGDDRKTSDEDGD